MGSNWKAAAIRVLVNPSSVGEFSILPSATLRKIRHAIMFVKVMYAGTRMKRRPAGTDEEKITPKFAKKRKVAALYQT